MPAVYKIDHVAMARRLDRLKAKADREVYAYVTARDGSTCRACGVYAGGTAHRHHLRGRGHTTREDVCILCPSCHADTHVRVGGKRLTIYGDAEWRGPYSGRLSGLVVERRGKNGDRTIEAGR